MKNEGEYYYYVTMKENPRISGFRQRSPVLRLPRDVWSDKRTDRDGYTVLRISKCPERHLIRAFEARLGKDLFHTWEEAKAEAIQRASLLIGVLELEISKMQYWQKRISDKNEEEGLQDTLDRNGGEK